MKEPKRGQGPPAEAQGRVEAEQRIKGPGPELQVLMRLSFVTQPVGILGHLSKWQRKSQPTSEQQVAKRESGELEQLPVAEADLRSVAVVDVLVIENQRRSGEIAVARSRVGQPEWKDRLQRQLLEQAVLGDQPELGEGEDRVMLLGRLVSQRADWPDLRAGFVVRGLGPREVERQVEPQVPRGDRRRLCAPDRERGVASARSGAGVSGGGE